LIKMVTKDWKKVGKVKNGLWHWSNNKTWTTLLLFPNFQNHSMIVRVRGQDEINHDIKEFKHNINGTVDNDYKNKALKYAREYMRKN